MDVVTVDPVPDLPYDEKKVKVHVIKINYLLYYVRDPNLHGIRDSC